MDTITAILSIGSTMVTGLAIAVGVLWKKLEKRDTDLKEQSAKFVEAIDKVLEKKDKLQDETNDAIRKTGNIIEGFKTLFEIEQRNRK